MACWCVMTKMFGRSSIPHNSMTLSVLPSSRDSKGSSETGNSRIPGQGPHHVLKAKDIARLTFAFHPRSSGIVEAPYLLTTPMLNFSRLSRLLRVATVLTSISMSSKTLI